VRPYLRRRVDGGARVPNPAFDRADHLVQAAAVYVEHEQERWHAHTRELVNERERKEAKKRAKAAAKGRGRGGRYGRRG
jgi:hypothetical protein